MGDNAPELRISDAERSVAVEALGQHFAVGRLGLTEYDERAARVSAALTRSELLALFTDLPEPHPRFDGQPAAAVPAVVTGGGAVAVPHDSRTSVQKVAAVTIVVLGVAWLPLMFTLGWWWFFFIPLGLGTVLTKLWGEDWDERDKGRRGKRKKRRK
ncbi:hypothetical protein JOF53_003533 [Crossiella equi]|uniref:DUF1707 domain-containing protein n=1 Tax=Crossiella equi TaxID=130796 RepID=A0ABS5ADL9_9PSEU|nr:DUF1707 domain-containing protein [Crossiella equi]MBP2474661.1 hypothetical protein [Crossiella equi]